MLQSRTRKVGNSIMISIPKELSPEANNEYIIVKTKSGAFIMTPKLPNPYKSSQKFEPADDNEIFEIESSKEIRNEN